MATWKSVEISTARILNVFFAEHNLSPVWRKPVNGRSGEDIFTNELGLAIDVKHRIEVPKMYVIHHNEIYQFRDLIGTMISNLNALLVDNEDPQNHPTNRWRSSIIVERWYDHMSDYCILHPELNLIPALVLHRPGGIRDHATFLIHKDDREKITSRIKEHKNGLR